MDIVCRQGDKLVFVEVRSRKGTAFGYPQESVNRDKQDRVRRLAAYYLKVHSSWQEKCRFDVIGIVFDAKDEIIALEHFKDAF